MQRGLECPNLLVKNVKGLRNTLKTVAIVLIILGGWVSIVSADVRQFIPKILDYSGFLSLESAYESHDDESEGRSIKNKDLFMKEKLTLGVLGYVYHPRFILFSLEVSGGLKQEKVSGNIQNSPFRILGSDEYDFRMYVLPKHSYNLELFTSRVEPLVKGVLSPQFQSAAYSSGAIFRYKQKPYFLDIHYVRNSSQSATVNYTTQKYGLLGTFYKELLGGNNYSFNVSYDHQTSSSLDTSGSEDDAALGNSVSYKMIHLSSEVSVHRFDQASLRGVSTSGKNFSWTERSNLSLPWNFSGDMSYILTKSWLTLTGPSIVETKLSDTVKNASFSISHRLYQSLISTYRYGYVSSTADTGQSTTVSNSLGFAYSKNIPGGRLRAQFSFGNANTDGIGSLSVVNEPHNGLQVPLGRFTLGVRNVEVETIIVFLKSPFAAGELVLLTKDVHYIVTTLENITQIDLLNLPPEFPVPGTYDFVVSYSSKNQKTGSRTTNFNSSISLELFEQMLVPYWNHDVSKETAVTNAAGEAPISFTVDTYGLMFRKRPFAVTAEYHVVSSNFNPSRGWKAQVNYLDSIFVNTEIDATVAYSSTTYPQGTSGVEVVAGYSETIFAATAGVRQKIPKRNLYLYLGGTYSTQKGLGQATTYSLNSTLSWNVGKISVDAGASASLAQTVTGGAASRRTDQYYYLSVKRKLF